MGIINSTNKNIVDKDLLTIKETTDKKFIDSITYKKFLSQGTNGSVFHICIYKDCKYILKEIEYNTENEKYFINEIENQSLLHKKFPKNIPKIKTYFKDTNKDGSKTFINIIMEYLKNYITLYEYLINNVNNINNNIIVITKILQFIEKMNKDNFLHGSLHTGNIMINKKGTKFYVIDYGHSINFNIKNSINIYNIPQNIIYSYDKFLLIKNLKQDYNIFKIEDDILRKLLIPDLNNYFDDYHNINYYIDW